MLYRKHIYKHVYMVVLVIVALKAYDMQNMLYYNHKNPMHNIHSNPLFALDYIFLSG